MLVWTAECVQVTSAIYWFKKYAKKHWSLEIALFMFKQLQHLMGTLGLEALQVQSASLMTALITFGWIQHLKNKIPKTLKL